MAFNLDRRYQGRLDYKKSGNDSMDVPAANFFASMKLTFHANLNIAGAPATKILPQQIARMVEEFRIIRDDNEISWQISGESLGRLFRKRSGKEAVDNVAIDGAIGTDKEGQLFLEVPFHPTDTPKPSDFLMDTTRHKYKIHVKYRDITEQGTLFGGTAGATITTNDSDCFIDVTFDKVVPVNGPNGKPDSLLAGFVPYFPDLLERTNEINQTKPDYKIEMPENQVIRNVFLFSNHEQSTDEIVGASDIFTDSLELKDTQGKTHQKIKARDLRQDTSLRWSEDTLEEGFYDLNLTKFGNMVDSLVSDSLRPLYIEAAVAPKTGTTRVTSVTQTIFQQGNA